MDMDLLDVRHICTAHQIAVKEITTIPGSFAKTIFLINQEYLLRVSEISMAHEQEKFQRVAGLPNVPEIVSAGIFQRETGPIHYTLLTLLPGDDFVNAYPRTTKTQQERLGEEVAGFLNRLHQLRGTQYDIGLYVPALPPFAGTWREGHRRYWELLRQESGKIPLQPGSSQVFERAVRFLEASGAALDFQTGPTLLHNDFHPKNILLHQGKFSGVIDWECSQYGEADFELCHLIHWCLYPPEPTIDFHPFLRAFFAASPRCAQVPRLAQRLTIYQIEHEIHQIIWSGGSAEALRVPRLVRWMNGAVEDLLQEING